MIYPPVNVNDIVTHASVYVCTVMQIKWRPTQVGTRKATEKVGSLPMQMLHTYIHSQVWYLPTMETQMGIFSFAHHHVLQSVHCTDV